MEQIMGPTVAQISVQLSHEIGVVPRLLVQVQRHLRSLNLRHFKTVEAKALKYGIDITFSGVTWLNFVKTYRVFHKLLVREQADSMVISLFFYGKILKRQQNNL
jgi:hypothetical protein